MNKVLVMGGNGFIGQNIVDFLDNSNVQCDIYDLYCKDNGHINFQGNILTDDNLENILSNYETVIYLITSVSPKKSMEFPELCYTQDIPMLLRVLDYSVKNNITKRIIFASSGGTVYGECFGDSLIEGKGEECPINHYAITKLTCEKILMLYNNLYNMENIVLRIANPYGVGQNPASGVGVITTFADKLLNGEEIVLYGDGTTVRDFVDVSFVAEAFYKAVIYNFDRSIIPIFNVGSGEEIDLNQIIKLISDELDVEPVIKYLPSRNFDVKKNVLNMEKSNKYLNLDSETNEVEKIKKYVGALKAKR